MAKSKDFKPAPRGDTKLEDQDWYKADRRVKKLIQQFEKRDRAKQPKAID